MGDLVLVLKLSTFQHPADCDLDFELRCNVKTPTSAKCSVQKKGNFYKYVSLTFSLQKLHSFYKRLIRTDRSALHRIQVDKIPHSRLFLWEGSTAVQQFKGGIEVWVFIGWLIKGGGEGLNPK